METFLTARRGNVLLDGRWLGIIGQLLMVIPSTPFWQRNPLSWYKILLDILFNTIFLLTWKDVCEGGRSVGRLLNPHEHKRTSNDFQSDVIFIFCLSYLHWQRSRVAKLLCKSAEISHHVDRDPCSINFSLCYQGLGSRMDDLFV